IQYEFKGDTCNIYINEDIAPYMPFTNEKWVAKRWNGKQNPNEQWFDNAVKFIVDEIRKELK
ncbi:MAG: hypothetical protein KBS91_02035, partial [Firmicutes bacterium]|nr:hypothetical protein [Candidatus Caballimonas caccae]